MNSRKQIHLLVIGRVQGIGFRYFVCQKAIELNLVGWVKNKMDGSVEIEVEGNPDTIKTFIDFLKIGNGCSRIDRIVKSELPDLQHHESFFIKY